MPAIPRRHRGRLASAAVGTLGVDTTTAELLSTVGGQVTQLAGGLARQDRAEQVERQKLLQKQRDAANTVAADRHAGDFETSMIELRRSASNLRDFSDRSSSLMQEFADRIEDPRAKEKFSTRAHASMKSQRDKFSAREDEERLAGIVTNINEALDSSAEAVSREFRDPSSDMGRKMEFLNDMVDRSRATLANAKDAISPGQFKAMSEQQAKTLAEAALTSMVDSTPELMEDFLSSPAIDDLFSDKEVDELRSAAADHIKKRNAFDELVRERQQFNTGQEFVQRVNTPEAPTETEIRQAERDGSLSEKDAKLIRGIKRSSKLFFSINNSQTQAQLSDSFRNMGFESTTERGIKAANKKLSFGQVSLFRQQIMEAMEAGEISQDQGNLWLKRISPKFNEGIDELSERFTLEEDGEHWFDDTVDMFTSPEEKDEARMTFQLMYMRRIDQAGDEATQQGKKLTFTQVKEISMETLEQFKLISNPNYGKYELGTILTDSDGVEMKVLGYDIDGEPVISLDLDTPIHQSRVPIILPRDK